MKSITALLKRMMPDELLGENKSIYLIGKDKPCSVHKQTQVRRSVLLYIYEHGQGAG